MKYNKIQQDILNSFYKTIIYYCKMDDFILITYDYCSVYVIPEREMLLDLNKIANYETSALGKIYEGLKDNKTVGIMTNEYKKLSSKVEVVRFDCDKFSTFVDKKLLKNFDLKKCEFRLGKGENDIITILENEKICGFVCPVKVD